MKRVHKPVHAAVEEPTTLSAEDLEDEEGEEGTTEFYTTEATDNNPLEKIEKQFQDQFGSKSDSFHGFDNLFTVSTVC